jgi:hypothetical protein
MAVARQRFNVLQIVNEVERKLGIRPSTTLTQRRYTEVLVDLLNDVIDEVSDYGDWQEMYREVEVTGIASANLYKVTTSAELKNIYEIHWDDDVAPLEHRTREVMRRLRRTGSVGTPRQWTIMHVSGTNPVVEVYPAPSSIEATGNAAFNVAYFKKPGLIFATASSSPTDIPALPSRVLVQGLYAKALLEEEAGQSGQKYQTAYAEYIRMRREALNRLTVDSGTDVYLVPAGKYGGRN